MVRLLMVLTPLVSLIMVLTCSFFVSTQIVIFAVNLPFVKMEQKKSFKEKALAVWDVVGDMALTSVPAVGPVLNVGKQVAERVVDAASQRRADADQQQFNADLLAAQTNMQGQLNQSQSSPIVSNDDELLKTQANTMIESPSDFVDIEKMDAERKERNRKYGVSDDSFFGSLMRVDENHSIDTKGNVYRRPAEQSDFWTDKLVEVGDGKTIGYVLDGEQVYSGMKEALARSGSEILNIVSSPISIFSDAFDRRVKMQREHVSNKYGDDAPEGFSPTDANWWVERAIPAATQTVPMIATAVAGAPVWVSAALSVAYGFANSAEVKSMLRDDYRNYVDSMSEKIVLNERDYKNRQGVYVGLDDKEAEAIFKAQDSKMRDEMADTVGNLMAFQNAGMIVAGLSTAAVNMATAGAGRLVSKTVAKIGAKKAAKAATSKVANEAAKSAATKTATQATVKTTKKASEIALKDAFEEATTKEAAKTTATGGIKNLFKLSKQAKSKGDSFKKLMLDKTKNVGKKLLQGVMSAPSEGIEEVFEDEGINLGVELNRYGVKYGLTHLGLAQYAEVIKQHKFDPQLETFMLGMIGGFAGGVLGSLSSDLKSKVDKNKKKSANPNDKTTNGDPNKPTDNVPPSSKTANDIFDAAHKDGKNTGGTKDTGETPNADNQPKDGNVPTSTGTSVANNTETKDGSSTVDDLFDDAAGNPDNNPNGNGSGGGDALHTSGSNQPNTNAKQDIQPKTELDEVMAGLQSVFEETGRKAFLSNVFTAIVEHIKDYAKEPVNISEDDATEAVNKFIDLHKDNSKLKVGESIRQVASLLGIKLTGAYVRNAPKELSDLITSCDLSRLPSEERDTMPTLFDDAQDSVGNGDGTDLFDDAFDGDRSNDEGSGSGVGDEAEQSVLDALNSAAQRNQQSSNQQQGQQDSQQQTSNATSTNGTTIVANQGGTVNVNIYNNGQGGNNQGSTQTPITAPTSTSASSSSNDDGDLSVRSRIRAFAGSAIRLAAKSGEGSYRSVDGYPALTSFVGNPNIEKDRDEGFFQKMRTIMFLRANLLQERFESRTYLEDGYYVVQTRIGNGKFFEYGRVEERSASPYIKEMAERTAKNEKYSIRLMKVKNFNEGDGRDRIKLMDIISFDELYNILNTGRVKFFTNEKRKGNDVVPMSRYGLYYDNEEEGLYFGYTNRFSKSEAVDKDLLTNTGMHKDGTVYLTIGGQVFVVYNKSSMPDNMVIPEKMMEKLKENNIKLREGEDGNFYYEFNSKPEFVLNDDGEPVKIDDIYRYANTALIFSSIHRGLINPESVGICPSFLEDELKSQYKVLPASLEQVSNFVNGNAILDKRGRLQFSENPFDQQQQPQQPTVGAVQSVGGQNTQQGSTGVVLSQNTQPTSRQQGGTTNNVPTVTGNVNAGNSTQRSNTDNTNTGNTDAGSSVGNVSNDNGNGISVVSDGINNPSTQTKLSSRQTTLSQVNTSSSDIPASNREGNVVNDEDSDSESALEANSESSQTNSSSDGIPGIIIPTPKTANNRPVSAANNNNGSNGNAGNVKIFGRIKNIMNELFGTKDEEEEEINSLAEDAENEMYEEEDEDMKSFVSETVSSIKTSDSIKRNLGIAVDNTTYDEYFTLYAKSIQNRFNVSVNTYDFKYDSEGGYVGDNMSQVKKRKIVTRIKQTSSSEKGDVGEFIKVHREFINVSKELAAISDKSSKEWHKLAEKQIERLKVLQGFAFVFNNDKVLSDINVLNLTDVPGEYINNLFSQDNISDTEHIDKLIEVLEEAHVFNPKNLDARYDIAKEKKGSGNQEYGSDDAINSEADSIFDKAGSDSATALDIPESSEGSSQSKPKDKYEVKKKHELKTHHTKIKYFSEEARDLWRSKGFEPIFNLIRGLAVVNDESVLGNGITTRRKLKVYTTTYKQEARTIVNLIQLGYSGESLSVEFNISKDKLHQLLYKTLNSINPTLTAELLAYHKVKVDKNGNISQSEKLTIDMVNTIVAMVLTNDDISTIKATSSDPDENTLMNTWFRTKLTFSNKNKLIEFDKEGKLKQRKILIIEDEVVNIDGNDVLADDGCIYNMNPNLRRTGWNKTIGTFIDYNKYDNEEIGGVVAIKGLENCVVDENGNLKAKNPKMAELYEYAKYYGIDLIIPKSALKIKGARLNSNPLSLTQIAEDNKNRGAHAPSMYNSYTADVDSFSIMNTGHESKERVKIPSQLLQRCLLWLSLRKLPVVPINLREKLANIVSKYGEIHLLETPMKYEGAQLKSTSCETYGYETQVIKHEGFNEYGIYLPSSMKGRFKIGQKLSVNRVPLEADYCAGACFVAGFHELDNMILVPTELCMFNGGDHDGDTLTIISGELGEIVHDVLIDEAFHAVRDKKNNNQRYGEKNSMFKDDKGNEVRMTLLEYAEKAVVGIALPYGLLNNVCTLISRHKDLSENNMNLFQRILQDTSDLSATTVDAMKNGSLSQAKLESLMPNMKDGLKGDVYKASKYGVFYALEKIEKDKGKLPSPNIIRMIFRDWGVKKAENMFYGSRYFLEDINEFAKDFFWDTPYVVKDETFGSFVRFSLDKMSEFGVNVELRKMAKAARHYIKLFTSSNKTISTYAAQFDKILKAEDGGFGVLLMVINELAHPELENKEDDMFAFATNKAQKKVENRLTASQFGVIMAEVDRETRKAFEFIPSRESILKFINKANEPAAEFIQRAKKKEQQGNNGSNIDSTDFFVASEDFFNPDNERLSEHVFSHAAIEIINDVFARRADVFEELAPYFHYKEDSRQFNYAGFISTLIQSYPDVVKEFNRLVSTFGTAEYDIDAYAQNVQALLVEPVKQYSNSIIGENKGTTKPC